MKKECKLIAEIACEIQFVVAEYNNISKVNQKHIIIDVADKMIKDGLFNEDSDDISEIVSKNIHLYIDIPTTFDNSFF